MTEERKHAILFAATLLCARKVQPYLDGEGTNCLTWPASLFSGEKEAQYEDARINHAVEKSKSPERTAGEAQSW